MSVAVGVVSAVAGFVAGVVFHTAVVAEAQSVKRHISDEISKLRVKSAASKV